MFGFDMDNSAFDDSGLNADMGCNDGMPVGGDFHMDGSHSIAFGRTGDASFDSLMDEVDNFNTETRQLTELARAEVAANAAGKTLFPSEASCEYTYNTGDSHLDGLLNEVQQGTAEYRALADQARMTLGPGKYLSIDDAINQGGRQGLSDFIQQRLDWMEHATPEQLQQYERQGYWQHEISMARAHEHDLLQEQGDLVGQFIKHQTKEQFDVEKAGYHQVNPWDTYRGYTGDPNIFEKDGEIYRLIPNSGGLMKRITSY